MDTEDVKSLKRNPQSLGPVMWHDGGAKIALPKEHKGLASIGRWDK